MEKKTTGLSLAEAHKSGNKYKRDGEDGWYRFGDYTAPNKFIEVVDALATDYELEPEAKLLTRVDVERAVHEALRGNIGPAYYDVCFARDVNDILFGKEGEG